MYVQLSVSTTGTETLGPHWWVEAESRAEAHRMLDDIIDKWEALTPADEQEREDPCGD